MLSAIRNTMSNVTGTIRSGFQGAISFITSLPSQAVQWGKDMIMGIVKGIKNSIGSVRSAVSNVARNIKSFLHFSVPDEGPLTDYESWMPDFIQGMTNGINDNKYRLVDAVQGMAGDMRMTMPSVANPRLKNIGGNNMQMQSTQSSDEKLYALLTQLINKVDNTGNITIPVYLGNDLIDEQIIRANDRRTLRSGGRA